MIFTRYDYLIRKANECERHEPVLFNKLLSFLKVINCPCFSIHLNIELALYNVVVFQGLVIGKLGQKRVIARVVRRTVMRKLFSCQQIILNILVLNVSSYWLCRREQFSEVNFNQGDDWTLFPRYCLLSYILCIRRFSSRLKKRFPDMEVGSKLSLFLYNAIFLALNLQSVLWRVFKVSVEIATNSLNNQEHCSIIFLWTHQTSWYFRNWLRLELWGRMKLKGLVKKRMWVGPGLF